MTEGASSGIYGRLMEQVGAAIIQRPPVFVRTNDLEPGSRREAETKSG